MDMKQVLAEILSYGDLYASAPVTESGHLSPVAKRYIDTQFALVARHMVKGALSTELAIEEGLITALGFDQIPEAKIPAVTYVHTLFTLRSSKLD